MSDQSSSSKYQRISFGDHIPIILAADIDNNELNSLFEKISSCCEVIFGGRTTVGYSNEVRFFSTFLYYVLNLDQDQSTIGQNFNGLKLVQTKLNEEKRGIVTSLPTERVISKTNPDVDPSLYTSLTSYTNTLSLTQGDVLQLALLLSLIPYLYSKRIEIFTFLLDTYNALTIQETDDVPVITATDTSILENIQSRDIRHEIDTKSKSDSSISGHNSSSSSSSSTDSLPINEDLTFAGSSSSSINNSVKSSGYDATTDILSRLTTQPSAQSSTESSAQSSELPLAVPSKEPSSIATTSTPVLPYIKAAISRFFHLLKKCWLISEASDSTRLQGLFTWLEAFHLHLFLVNASFYHLALRMRGVRLIKSSISQISQPPQSKIPMGSLAFISGLQLSILSAHAAVRFFGEILNRDNIDASLIGDNRETGSERDIVAGGVTGLMGERLGRGELENRGQGRGSGKGAKEQGGGIERKEEEGEVTVDMKDEMQRSERYEIDKEREKERERNKSRQCPLCMDALSHPAATPCGHVYCWSCLNKWCKSYSEDSNNNRHNNRNHSRNTGDFNNNISTTAITTENDIKCPVCRQFFKQHNIRALFNYS